MDLSLEHFELWEKTLGWQPSTAQQQLFEQIYAQLLAANRQLNLTRITTPAEFWEKHLWDSLRGVGPWLNPRQAPLAAVSAAIAAKQSVQVIDVGTGGGFPGLPVAIARPHWQLQLLDSTRKKVAFLAELGQSLNLNVAAIAARAEALGQDPDHRGRYDIALVRAVGTAPTCAEYALPLLKQGGIAVLYRGHWSSEEAQRLVGVAADLGGQVIATDACQTPLSQGVRHYLFLQKQRPTPRKFPRAIGIPAKLPLGQPVE